LQGHRPCHVLDIFDKKRRSIDGLVNITKSFIIETVCIHRQGPNSTTHRDFPLMDNVITYVPCLLQELTNTQFEGNTLVNLSLNTGVHSGVHSRASTYVCIICWYLKVGASTLIAGWSHIRILRKQRMVCSLADRRIQIKFNNSRSLLHTWHTQQGDASLLTLALRLPCEQGINVAQDASITSRV